MFKKFSARSDSGSVILYTLLIVAVSTLLFVGWIEVMLVRGNYVNTIENAIQRRVGLANSEALLRQYAMSQVMVGTSGGGVAAQLDAGWGGIEILPWNGSPFAAQSAPPFVNHFNPGAGRGFARNLSAILESGGGLVAGEDTRFFEARRALVGTRSPVASGFLLTMQTPTMVPSATVAVPAGPSSSRGAFLWNPNSPNTFGFSTTRFSTPNVVPAPPTLPAVGGGTVLPSNLAFPAIFTVNYSGSLDVVNNPFFPQNSLTQKVLAQGPLIIDAEVAVNHGTPDGNGNFPIQSDGDGFVRVLLSQDNHNYFVLQNLEQLRLEGAGGGSTALVFLIDQTVSSTRDLLEIEFAGLNTRPLFLIIKKSSGLEVIWDFTESGAVWRLLATLENTPVALQSAGGTLVMQGGIRTDRTFDASGVPINLVPGGEFPVPDLLDRHGWVEVYSP